MFIIDDIFAAAWPAISSAASTAMNVIGGVNAAKGAMSGNPNTTQISPMTGGNVDESIGDISNITNAISGNPIVNLYGQYNKAGAEQDKQDELDNNAITAMINSNNQRVAAEDQYITGGIKQYFNGGVPNDGKPAVIYDMRTGQPTGTMNERGPERIVPAYDGSGSSSIVDTIVKGTQDVMGGTSTSPQNAISRPNGTFMGMGDFGESMRSMLRLVGTYQDMKRQDVGLGKSALTPWLDWMDTQDKTAMVMNAKEAAIKAKEAKDKEENYKTFMKDATKMAIDKGYEPGTKQFELAKTGYFNALKNSYEGVPTKNINVSTTKREGRVFKKDKTQSKSVLPEEAEIIKQDIIDFKNGYLKDHPKATPDEITKAAESKFGKIEFK